MAITQMYKQLVMESKRSEAKQQEKYIDELVSNFIEEMKQHSHVRPPLLY